MVTSQFKIYNASAGSGKTFTLVKEYLKILFKSNHKEQYKHILAITFTNKAVGEMKERIIETLKQFSSEIILKTSNSMFEAICKELPIDPNTLHNKSKGILNSIIHNYAAFDVSTIDGFTHKLIRTFAYDLKLPLNFEVELDTESLLNEAVDSLIAKAGGDKKLTKVLIDFAIEKADDDKSWDVSYDFNKIAKLLVNENDIPFLDSLKDKTLEDFEQLKTLLKVRIKAIEEHVIEKSRSVLTLIEASGLEFNDFSGSYLPKHFKNLAEKRFDLNFEAKWQEDLESKTLYPKRVTNDIASIVEEIQPQIASAFNDTKKDIFQYRFLKAIYKNITPLSVLNAINKELEALKADQNKMLISEFNTIISNEIKTQPTPFIYERLGEKFRHYFIDEFQDTSVLQWKNLIPLIGNSLSTESGSAMLVGDAKQAIYRWRGGKAEQFINLYNKKKNPFYVEQKVENLPVNYRSHKEIITFNNGFFNYLSNTVFSNEDYRHLYSEANQNMFSENNGFVNMSFLEINKEDNRDDIYPEKVLETVTNCLEHGFALKDICVLVRKKKEGIAVAEHLSLNGKKIMSSETMLIQNSHEVTFINNILKLLLQPNNNEIKVEALNYLAKPFSIEDKHAFFEQHIHLELTELLKRFERFNIYINPNNLLQLPLYDLAETIVRSFNLVKTSDAYVQFYLDVVLDYSQKQFASLSGFIDYFEKKKDSLSIVSPKGQDAIQIMTIHKSKGLEFPVVIFPYADLDIYKEIEPKEWFPLEADTFNGFSNTLLNYNKDFENFGDDGRRIYNNHQAELELDNINLLYVALTRPMEQLYIISKKDINAKGISNNSTFSGMFINFLKNIDAWDDAQSSYSFGDSKKTTSISESIKDSTELNEFISTAKESHNIKVITNSGFLWDTKQQEALEKGNLIHNMMSRITTRNDVDFVINDFIISGIINTEQSKELHQTLIQIVEHPKLKDYFIPEHTIYNERDIISKDGNILRPDRLIINSANEVVIVDYKTGHEDGKHRLQLEAYQNILEEMGCKVINKILVYINDDIQIKEI